MNQRTLRSGSDELGGYRSGSGANRVSNHLCSNSWNDNRGCDGMIQMNWAIVLVVRWLI